MATIIIIQDEVLADDENDVAQHLNELLTSAPEKEEELSGNDEAYFILSMMSKTNSIYKDIYIYTVIIISASFFIIYKGIYTVVYWEYFSFFTTSSVEYDLLQLTFYSE